MSCFKKGSVVEYTGLNISLLNSNPHRIEKVLPELVKIENSNWWVKINNIKLVEVNLLK